MIKKTNFWICMFLVPSAILYFLIFAAPLVTVIITSFCKFKGMMIPEFIGIENYKNLIIKDGSFRDAFRNTIVWILLQATIHVGFGVLVALILFRKPFGWKFVRTSFMVTNIIPTSAIAMLFILAMNPQMGVVNSIIRAIGFSDFSVNWFGDSSYSFFAVTITWLLYAPVVTIFVLAEIGAIPESVFESARVDGANNIQIDTFIILPMLKNILGTCVILASISMVTEFDQIYMTTRGGPGTSTLNLPLYLYKTANLQMDYGVANTIGVFQILTGLILVFIIGKLFIIGNSYN